MTDVHGNEDFQSIIKEIKRKDHTIETPKYFIFDMLTLKEFTDKELNDFEVVIGLAKDKKNYYLEVVDEFEEWKETRKEKIKSFEEAQEKAKKEIIKASKKK
jgi:hypothetical protein